MKGIVLHQRSAISIAIIVAGIFLLTNCINTDEKPVTAIKQTKKTGFAGSAACAACHKDIYTAHLKTAHFHTSEIADSENIQGSFATGKNSFTFGNGGTVKMEQRPGGFYQAVFVEGVEKKAQRFDVVFGSGTKGQSYATWAGNTLLQLPITYFTSAHQWSNSPGYPNKIALNRVVTARCLECHTTYMEKISEGESEPEKFNKTNMVLGVDCEKCHGPAAEHATFQSAHPLDTTGAFIIKPASFTRAQSIDMCALCHGGRLQKTTASFSFTAGDRLADYFLIDSSAKDPNAIDVHGNQYGLLAASQCFLKSNTLTCITCHSPHENEKGKAALFAQKCISCHNEKQAGAVVCAMTASMGAAINNQCTNCHMPEQPSKSIAVLLQGKDEFTSATMHTHLIKAYPEETKRIQAFIKAAAAGNGKQHKNLTAAK